MDYTKKLILYGMSMFRDNVIEMLSEKYGSFEKAKEHILFFSDSDKKYGGIQRDKYQRARRKMNIFMIII